MIYPCTFARRQTRILCVQITLTVRLECSDSFPLSWSNRFVCFEAKLMCQALSIFHCFTINRIVPDVKWIFPDSYSCSKSEIKSGKRLSQEFYLQRRKTHLRLCRKEEPCNPLECLRYPSAPMTKMLWRVTANLRFCNMTFIKSFVKEIRYKCNCRLIFKPVTRVHNIF